jgi:hypothetical protein
LKKLNVYNEIIQIDEKVRERLFDVEKIQLLRREVPELGVSTHRDNAAQLQLFINFVVDYAILFDINFKEK